MTDLAHWNEEAANRWTQLRRDLVNEVNRADEWAESVEQDWGGEFPPGDGNGQPEPPTDGGGGDSPAP